MGALRYTETARARIVKAGGECITFDKLALRSPLGQGTVLLRGAVKCREADKHFGTARCSPQPPEALRACEGPEVRVGSWPQEVPRLQGLRDAGCTAGLMMLIPSSRIGCLSRQK